jgi:hypothetical protein
MSCVLGTHTAAACLNPLWVSAGCRAVADQHSPTVLATHEPSDRLTTTCSTASLQHAATCLLPGHGDMGDKRCASTAGPCTAHNLSFCWLNAPDSSSCLHCCFSCSPFWPCGPSTRLRFKAGWSLVCSSMATQCNQQLILPAHFTSVGSDLGRVSGSPRVLCCR